MNANPDKQNHEGHEGHGGNFSLFFVRFVSFVVGSPPRQHGLQVHHVGGAVSKTPFASIRG